MATTGLRVEERVEPTTPTQAVSEPTIQKASGKGSIPEVEAERYGNLYSPPVRSFFSSVLHPSF